MTIALEVIANALNAGSIVLAGRNSIHTWWTGIAGCAAFAVLFYSSQLYADVTLQIFFIVTSVFGWIRWRAHAAEQLESKAKRIRRTPVRSLIVMFGVAMGVAVAYGLLLQRFTNAFAPGIDSAILTISVLGQWLLIARRIETWWCWILANTLAVPLYFARGLHVTAVLYVLFLFNAWLSLRYWRQQMLADTDA